ncbi:MAG: iron dependent repressor, metal binding and dimerization domain protein, partial [Candidatus Margulisiibacteriota bacterium]
MTNREVDEILEIIWMKKEEGKKDLCAVEEEIRSKNLRNLIKNMEKDGLISIEGEDLSLTPAGEKNAADLIRRHRLAERLLTDVLETGSDGLEDSACEFEHILSEEVTDAICILLGHPKECPHGLHIPEGACCKKTKEVVESLVPSLDKVSAAKGGDLDWFSPSAMVPEFGNAITALKKGETSAAPAKTE